MKAKLYVFQGDVESHRMFPNFEVTNTIDFGKKHKGQTLESVILKDMYWFLWALEVDTLPQFTVPVKYLIEFKKYTKAFDDVVKLHLDDINIQLSLKADHDTLKMNLFLTHFPNLRNSFWELFFLKHFYSFNILSDRFKEIFENAYLKIQNLCNNYGYASDVRINMLCQDYLNVGQILREYNIGFDLYLAPLNSKCKYQPGKLKIYIGAFFDQGKAQNIVSLFLSEIDEILISYRSFKMIFTVRDIIKHPSFEIEKTDISESINPKDFLAAFSTGAGKHKIDYNAVFPNINPREIEDSEYERPDYRDYRREEQQANNQFYREFGDSFHEDMIGNDR